MEDTQTQDQEQRQTGVVKWFNSQKGYGFIERANGGDIFVHVNDSEVGPLEEGKEVSFVETEGRKGPNATKVTYVEKE